MKKKLSTTEFIRKRQAGSPEEGEVIDPNEEIASGFAGGREPGKAEEAFRALVEGSQGFLGLEPGRRGSEAYRTGQALSNLPALALPAAAIKGTGKAKDALKGLFPNDVFRVVNPGDEVSGLVVRKDVPNMGSISATLENYEVLPGIREVSTKAFDREYLESLDPTKLSKRTSELSNQINQSREINPLIVGVDSKGAYVIEGGHRFDALMTQKRGSVPAVVVVDKDDPPVEGFLRGLSTTDFIRKREKGSPPEGEVTNDEYIQQMFTGTPPANRTTNPGILPPELRQAVDVPLDFLNLLVRGGAGAVAGPAYGLYKGITSDKFGTPEGVQEASSEAGRMMQKITGTPKTQTGRDVMEFIGEKAEALKLAPTPQLLTAPLPGPGSASALLRNYELAETPPMGAINVPGTKAQVTPPKNEMGFFSPTEQVVMNLPQEKGTAQQMLAQISKAPGAKAAELRATGLEEFLKGKGTAPVTRQEIQDYLANNRVQVDEVVLGKGQTLSPEAKRLADDANARMAEIYDEKMLPFFEQIVARGETLGGQEPYSVFSKLRGPLGRKAAKGDQEALAEIDALNLPPEIKDLVLEYGRNKNEYIKFTGQARRMEKPKFDKYNIPGGTNAREIYLTLPLREPAIPEGYGISSVQYDDGSVRYFANTPTTRSAGYRTEQEAMSRLQEQIVGLRDFREDVNVLFRVPDIHSVSPEADRNRLAHIFLDDRTDAEGKKVLFVQELQSDWAQQGRDKGFEIKSTPWDDPEYKAARARSTELLNEFNENNANPVRQNEIRPLLDEARRLEQSFEGKRGLPSAPFVTTTDDWVNLALKRVIKDAVDNGYDKVAFIKGEQAAKKYRLSTVLDGIEVGPSQLQSSTFLSPNSPRLVELKQKEGGIIPLFVNQKGVVETVDNDAYRQFMGKPLSEIVGKEMSEKIMTATLKPGGESSVNFDVKDMEVGGQGMKGFYDNILPKTANKLLAKLGSKIEPVDVVKGAPSQMPFESSSFLDWMQQNHPGTSRSDAARAWGMGIDNNMFVREFYEATKADQHLGFKITPEMADMVKTQGLPQFAAGGEVTKFIKAHA